MTKQKVIGVVQYGEVVNDDKQQQRRQRRRTKKGRLSTTPSWLQWRIFLLVGVLSIMPMIWLSLQGGITTATTDEQQRNNSKKNKINNEERREKKKVTVKNINNNNNVPPSSFSSSSSNFTTSSQKTPSSTTRTTMIPQQQQLLLPIPRMVLFVRMSGTLKSHQFRFLCTLLRSIVLFWNEEYSTELVLVLDDEMNTDHDFGNQFLQEQINNNSLLLPKYWKIHIQYESLPNDRSILSSDHGMKLQSVGYKRQLYHSFWSDIFVIEEKEEEKETTTKKKKKIQDETDTNQYKKNEEAKEEEEEEEEEDTLLVFLDNDAMFLSPVTGPSIFDDTRRPRIYGVNCTFDEWWVKHWRKTTRMALGKYMVADFMVSFPVYIYASTIRNCRNYIVKRYQSRNHHHPRSGGGRGREGGGNHTTLNTTTTTAMMMEDAFAKFFPIKTGMSPICILLNYAWYFERDRYSWSFQICPGDSSNNLNRRIPIKDRISTATTTTSNVNHDHDTWTTTTGTTTTTSNVHYSHHRTPWPSTAFHQSYARNLTNTTLEASFCLAAKVLNQQQQKLMGSSAATTNRIPIPLLCRDKYYDWKDNYVLFHHNMHVAGIEPSPCVGNDDDDDDGGEQYCKNRLQQHYETYANEVLGINGDSSGDLDRSKTLNGHTPERRPGRPPLDWNRIAKVEELAKKHWDITCPPITSIYGDPKS